ncbi:DUF420 domain-containing protein [Natrialba swarupiae]|nr:DUF420 domain-containing protein [Natrialba swarupiae]
MSTEIAALPRTHDAGDLLRGHHPRIILQETTPNSEGPPSTPRRRRRPRGPTVTPFPSRANDHVWSTSRERVRPIAAVLSVVSLAVVFAAAGGRLPQSAVPGHRVGADGDSARERGHQCDGDRHDHGRVASDPPGDVARHRAAMLASFALFVTFLTLYLYRLVATGGPQPFPVPRCSTSSSTCPSSRSTFSSPSSVSLLYYALLLAFACPVDGLRRTNHARVGRLAAGLWLISFSLGIVVYGLLHVAY